MKKLLIIICIILFSGCSEKEKEKVYVDANGSVINERYKQLRVTQEIRCDKRGYAYYETSFGHGYSLTPILYNGIYGTYQELCKDL